jgi:excinuclease UvrABC nuclease subunit
MKVYRFRPPYKANGKTTYPDTRQKSGVYIIKENGRIVYVGRSAANLYKTLYRHFEHWSHRSQEVTTYKGSRKSYTVRVILCTPRQAARLEMYLIKKIQPRDNEAKYKAYQLDFSDISTGKAYEAAPVLTEDPF